MLALLVSGRIELAGLAVGLATGFKYPGVLLIVPLVVAGLRRRAARSRLLLSAAAFFATSPFSSSTCHRPGTPVQVQRLANDGWLGFEHDTSPRSRSSTGSGTGSGRH